LKKNNPSLSGIEKDINIIKIGVHSIKNSIEGIEKNN
jgi:hypothetical protein